MIHPAQKSDFVVYDQPGWGSFTYNFPIAGGIRKRSDGRLVLQFETADEICCNDDFYYAHYHRVVMDSRDEGGSWKEIQPKWAHDIPLQLPDGTLLEVVESRRLRSSRENLAHFKRVGLEHLWHEDCHVCWDLWPESMVDELRRKGLNVWTRQGDCIPPGVVATAPPTPLVMRRSFDSGVTWQQQTLALPEIQRFAHFGTCFSGGVVMSDGVVLLPFYGLDKRSVRPGEFTFEAMDVCVLRSDDRGDRWQVATIAQGGAGDWFSETCLASLPTGRVVAMIRAGEIYCSASDDGGSTWATPQPTGIYGEPLHLTCLASGNLLCTYAHRKAPGGIRATLSRDNGVTWNAGGEVILRDDAPASDYIGGPCSVQLSDESILSVYNLVGDPILGDGRHHCYIAASRYTESFLLG